MNTVLITGASSGFGEACAIKYSKSADHIILVARNIDKLKQLKEQLQQSCEVTIAEVDVADRQSIEQFTVNCDTELKKVDILVNNAGKALGLSPAHESDIDQWEEMIDTNIKGLVRLTRRILPYMVKNNNGHIVNIGSIAGNWPYPGGNVYGATKSFVHQFSRGLRSDLIGKKIRVTCVEPGLAKTNFSVVRFGGDIESAQNVYQDLDPLTAEDIADIIYWVTSVPKHVNINALEVMPTCQAWAPLAVDRTMKHQGDK